VNFPSFSQIVTIVQNAVNNYSTQLVDFGVGRPFYALVNAIGDGYSYLLTLLQQVLAASRLNTAQGADVDSWLAQFQGFTRLPAVTATGQVTFSRYVAASAALIVPGLLIKTADGTLNFTVTGDPTNGLWNAGMGGYLLPIGTLSATVPVAAAATGSLYNVQAGTISLISGSVAGIDNVTNVSAISNGVDAESDTAAVARFWRWFSTLAQGTKPAIEYAISTVQQGISYNTIANQNAQGVVQNGFYTVYIDDRTGTPSPALLASVTQALAQATAWPITYAVLPCIVVPAQVSVTIYAQNGYVKANLIAPVATAISNYINGLGVGNPMYYSNLGAQILSVEGVSNYENLYVNGQQLDVGGQVADSVHPTLIVVN
jgi:uncharacterized phage protein gp47/JayE